MKMRLLKTGVTLAALLAMTVPMAANAQQVIQQDQIIIQDTTVARPVTPMVALPTNRVGAGQHLLFWVTNPSSGPVVFSMPEVGIHYPVAANSDRTFFVDMANVMDREVAYAVLGPNGEQLASGTVINEDFFQVGSATALANIINYSTAYSAPLDPEPEYRERPVSRPVRGYW